MKVKLGDYVSFTILDHVQASGHSIAPLEVEVVGRVQGLYPEYVELLTWRTTDLQYSNNNEGFAILRKTIKKVRRLR